MRLANSIDESMGFVRYDSGKKKVGWLINMHSTTVEDEKIPGGRAGVDYYFLEEDGGTFKATVEYDPYFLIAVRKGKEPEVERDQADREGRSSDAASSARIPKDVFTIGIRECE